MERTTVTRHAFPLSLQYIMYADPLRVFDAFTKKELIEGWCDGGGEVELSVGGAVRFFDKWVSGEVVSFDRAAGKFVFTWKPSEWPAKTPASVVSIEFRNHPAGTVMLIEHGGFPTSEEADKHLNGWTDYVLDPMNDFFTS